MRVITSRVVTCGVRLGATLALSAVGLLTGGDLYAASAAPEGSGAARQDSGMAARCSRVEVAPPVQVAAGKSAVVRPASPITRVLLGSDASRAAAPRDAATANADRSDAAAGEERQRPGVASIDVLLLGPSEVYVLGKTLGTTNLVLLEQAGRCTVVDVVVSMDTAALQSLIAQLMPDEKDVRVTAAFDSIVLTGMVSSSAALGRVLELANAYVRSAGNGAQASVSGVNPRIVNMLATGAPQQVMLEVKVAEVSKVVLDKLGMSISGSIANGNWSATLLSNLLSGGNAAASIVKAGSFNATLDAQKDDGLVKILAEPTVMAISGQKGSFLAGGKIFIPVAVDNAGLGRSITLEEKEFGVSVSFLPTVLDGGRINLEVASEVSELNRDGVGLTVPGTSGLAVLPAFTSRRTRTTVQLADGQSFAVGGLIKNNATHNLRALPLLGELPVLGALFRSTQFQTDRSELVFVITPRLVKPLPPGYALPTDRYQEPTRAQVLLGGQLEGASGAQPSAADAGGFQVK